MQTLARAVMSIMLQQPNNAYASPGRVLKNKESYKRIFDEKYNRDMYVVCILAQRQVEKYLIGRGAELKDVRSIYRYYIAMAIICELLQHTSQPTDKEIASLLGVIKKGLSNELLEGATSLVTDIYQKDEGKENFAKGSEMLKAILMRLTAKFATKGPLV